MRTYTQYIPLSSPTLPPDILHLYTKISNKAAKAAAAAPKKAMKAMKAKKA